MNNNQDVGILVKLKAQDTTKQLKNLNSESKSLQKNMKLLGNTITEAFNQNIVLGWAKVIKKVTDTMINATKKQTEYAENLHLLRSAYGSVNSSGEQLVQTMANLSGLDIADLTKSLGQYRQLANALGIASDSANLLSENLLKMQNDIASLYNMDTEQVGKKLMSALTGETKAIKILGADVTSAALQQRLYNMGINESITNMNTAEKTILRYLAVQDQLKNSQGDYANTINSVANQTKIWNAQIEVLGRQLSSFLIPLLQRILPILNGIMMAINTIIGTVLGLFGIKSDVGSIADEFETIGDSIGNVTKASKEANKSLRGFDKLNVIRTPSSNSGAGTGVGGGINSKLLAQLKEYNDGLLNANNKARKIQETILGWFGYTKDTNGEFKFSGKLIDKIKLGILGVGVAFAFIYPIYKVLKNVFGLFKGKKLKDTAKDLKDVGKSTSVISDGFKDMLKSFGKATEIIAILGGLALVIKEITKLIDTFSKSGLDVNDVLKLLAVTLGTVVIAFGLMATIVKNMDLKSALNAIAILGGLALVLDQVNDLIETMAKNNLDASDVTLVLVGILSSLLLFMTGIALIGPAMTAGLLPFLVVIGGISAILLVMKATLPTILDAVGTFIERTAPSLIEVIRVIFDGINKLVYIIGITLPGIIESTGKLFDSIFSGMSQIIETIGKSMEGILNTVKDLVIDVLRELLNFIRKLGPAIETFVNSAIRSVTKLINFIVSGIEYLINTLIVNNINNLLRQVSQNKIAEILGINKKVTYMKQAKISRFNPKLYYNGGFPTKGDMFIANERKPEYVGSINNKPAVANQNQIVDGISTGVARAMMSIKQPKQPIVIEAEGDTQGLLDFIHFKEKDKDRQFGL